jgi:PEP-CTERM motif
VALIAYLIWLTKKYLACSLENVNKSLTIYTVASVPRLLSNKDDMMKFFPRFAIACSFFAMASAANAATFTGQSVTGTIASPFSFPTLTPFASPAVVGSGVEFSTTGTDVFGTGWAFTVDFAATSLTIKFTAPSNPNGNVNASPILNMSFGGFSGVTPLAFASYTCAPPADFACTTFSGGPNSTILSSTSTAFNVQFDVLRTGETYVFGVIQAVPEPATWAMLITGFGLTGTALRRRRSARVSIV